MLNTTIHGEGYPLIWGHGLMGNMALESATGWFHPPAGLIRRIRYDARGHGQSSGGAHADEHRWDRLAQDMLNVASAHAGQERFALGGQSMGCATALYAALAAPQQVSHLVLALPPTAWASRPAQVERYGKMLDVIRARGVASLVNLARQFPSVPGWLHRAQPEANEQALLEMARFDERRLGRILEGAMHSDLPPRSELAALSMPALVLAWADDDIHPLATARYLNQTLPNARLVEIDTMPQLQAWPRLIDEFVNTAGGA
ncbi:Pimeloyl-ACP methyl ester carboxylesterase [Halopseudomonas xinjiangensis]|uniref:Pimeloyl-ACP methyl ester carboxylesterase n=1 Tax=Halopseudomonas xinjiangensis TaxID=487184 RepID=A0A1H1MWM3_9GAMM|nr:alpha/beta hydrolase [Halopseudomonas xinjiangensis]SDR90339.1 Pimeloyl-ACP methyl ester carboxylesterase [Halopseudomonas xinjiangensis]